MGEEIMRIGMRSHMRSDVRSDMRSQCQKPSDRNASRSKERSSRLGEYPYVGGTDPALDLRRRSSSPREDSQFADAHENHEKPEVPFRLLCAMAKCVLAELGPNAPPSEVIDELKWQLSRARIPYPSPDRFVAVYDAVLIARRKGYL